MSEEKLNELKEKIRIIIADESKNLKELLDDNYDCKDITFDAGVVIGNMQTRIEAEFAFLEGYGNGK